MTPEPPPHLIDWHGEPWTPGSGTPGRAPERALHRARRAVPVDRARVGGPGGRADLGDPLRRPPRGHACRSSTRRAPGSTASSSARRWPPRRPPPRPGAVGKLRRDPFAMLPFCGYHMGDYFAHWLAIGAAADRARSCRASSRSTGSARTPTAASCGPGFGENSRVLAWIAERCEGTAGAVETAIGLLPAPGALPVEDLDISRGRSRGAARGRRGRLGGRAAAPGRVPRDVRRPLAGRAAERNSTSCAPGWRAAAADRATII